MNKAFSYILITFFCFAQTVIKPVKQQAPPRLTVVIVIDQFAYHYLPKLHKHLKGGIGKLMSNGTFFTRAFYEHGIPETTPGHATLSTATLPKDHGAVTNQWIDPITEKKVSYVTYDEQKHPSFHTRTDGVSDVFMLKKDAYTPKVFAFSLKDYPAVLMAQQLGRAFWFDTSNGSLKSSSHYQKVLPAWLKKHHADNYLSIDKTKKEKFYPWQACFDYDNPAYDYPAIDCYDYAGHPTKLVNNKVPIDQRAEKPYDLFMKCPGASQLLLDAAVACVHAELTEDNRMLLWISLSNFDLAGHLFGPHSRELIDLLYQLDQQLDNFFKEISQQVKPQELLIALTADHGIAPIPEVMQKLGYKNAHRIMAHELMNKINKKMRDQYPRLKKCHPLKAYEPTSFIIDKNLKKLFRTDHEYKEFLHEMCQHLEAEPGIKNAWLKEEIRQEIFPEQQRRHERFYSYQLYKDRIGDIIIQPEPYCQVTQYPTGTSHMTPYEYDTHVPLVFYRPKSLTRAQIHEPVTMTQFGVTLAHLLDCNRPAAATAELLPGIQKDKNFLCTTKTVRPAKNKKK